MNATNIFLKIAILASIIFLTSCNKQNPKETLQKSLAAIDTIKSCQYKYHSSLHDNNYTETFIIDKNEANRHIEYDYNSRLIIINNYQPDFIGGNNNDDGLLLMLGNIFYLALNPNEAMKLNTAIDSISVSQVNDTITILIGNKHHENFSKYELTFKNNLPTYFKLSYLVRELDYNYTVIDTDIQYTNINNIPHSIIAEYQEKANDVYEENRELYLKKILNNNILYLKGRINDYPILMALNNTNKNGKNMLTGSYYYTRKGIPIEVNGELQNDGTFTLKEINNGKITGYFNGKSTTHNITGTWNKPNGSDMLNFELSEDTDVAIIDWIKKEKSNENGSVSLELPQINTDYTNNDITNNVNKTIQSLINGGSADNFILLLDDFEPTSSLETFSHIYYNNNNILSLTISSYYYMAGTAHPNSETTALNFDLETGEQITFENIFHYSEDKEKLNKLAIDNFKKALNDNGEGHSGWDIENIPNYLPSNFVFTPQGIRFFFNRYEIGPYAAGSPPDILIPYKEIVDLVDIHSPIGRIYKTFE